MIYNIAVSEEGTSQIKNVTNDDTTGGTTANGTSGKTKICTGGSHLSRIFWEHENLSGLSIIQLIYIKLYRKKETKFWKKKSGLSGNLA